MSKRILVIILTVCLAVVGMTVMVFAEDIASGTGWTLADDGKLTISSESGTSNWYRYGRSKYNESVKSVVIDSGVTTISDSAFYNCTNLESVSIPDTVETIGESAFSHCESLTSITIPGGVETIGQNAFYYCMNLETVTLGISVKTIGESAFSLCERLTSITIPDSVETIGENAFYYCISLTSITIPDSVETIGASAFSNCTDLETVTLGSSVETIGEGAFSYCESLTSIAIPDGVQTIEGYTFAFCSGLTSVTIPNSVTTIEKYAFQRCTKLSTVELGSKVTTIGEAAFGTCTSLTSITIPKSVTSIGNGAFYLGSSTAPDVITDVYYEGSDIEWNKISISERNSNLTNAFIHYSSTSIHTYTLEPKFTWSEDCSECTFSFVCSVCGSAKSTHDCTVNDETTTEASCTETGLKNCTATVTVGTTEYKEVKQNVVVAATGRHTEVIDQAVEATCTSTGLTEGSHCSVCNTVLVAQEVVPMKEHTVVTDEAVAATCTETGLTEGSHCSVCSAVIVEQEVVAALGHDYEISYFTWADGYKSATATFKCANCSDEQTVNATVSVENYYGMYVYVATARYGANGATYSSVKTSGTVDMSGLETNSTSEITTEEVETDEPVEGTDTETETDDEAEANPTTGMVVAMLPMAIALAGAVASKQKLR